MAKSLSPKTVGESKTNSLEAYGRRASIMLGSIAGVLCLALVFFISIDVIARGLRLSMRGTLEISRLTLAWICFASIVYTYTRGQHVRVGVFVACLGRRGQALAEVLSCLLGAALMFSIFWKSVPFFLESWGLREIFNVDIPLPYWLAKMSVPVGTFVFGFIYGADLFVNLWKAIRPRE